MDSTGRFSASSWSKNNPPHCSDCRLLMLYKVVKKLWSLWRCSGQLATTSRAMDKWMWNTLLQLHMLQLHAFKSPTTLHCTLPPRWRIVNASRYFNSSYFNLLHRTFSPNRCVLYFSNWIVIVVVDIFNCLCLYFSSSFPWFRCRTTPAANATPARKQERRQEDYDFIFFVSIATTKCPTGAVCGLIYNFYKMLQTPMPGRTRGS